MAKKIVAYRYAGRMCVIEKELATPKPILIRFTDRQGGLCRVFMGELEEVASTSTAPAD